MDEMKVANLNVDLIQDQAMVGLIKQVQQSPTGKFGFTNVTVNVPLATPGDQQEHEIRRHAIDQARRALKEAIQVLDAYAA